MGVTEEAGKVAGGVIDAMKGTPMLIVLLLLNAGFLGSIVYLMGEAVANSSERNRSQLELISKLVTDIRDCKQGPKQQRYDPNTKSLIRIEQ
jgi:uncharacterized membrane protein